ncbi:uncharacterized protein LOC106050690 isoform X1 [Biomphalaria glabrata]|uniref:Uncharacterized protein LOC106050690 isoform X1 n=1 Tax=Biomphalaria glabrata TaxID=6526 RepID=A0A9W2ZDN1_BIOGL|nr:uncharacterized protein LOC106050690 isoform X1 [Biomphalaria glabrata]
MPPRGKLKQQDDLRLRKNHLLLKNELDALKITDFLYEKDILDRDDIERIESGRTTMERNEILLRRISNIGPEGAFDIFLDSLKEDYKHLYDALVKEPTTHDQKAVEESHCATSNATGGNDRHIMISYCHADKEIVHKIYHSLQSLGYNLWIDKEKMEINVFESMSQAVEDSSIVIMCISQKYKDSAYCKMEAEYTSNLKKDYLIVKVTPNYKPDGWLGLMLGQKLYFDFCGRSPYDTVMQELVKQIEVITRKQSSSS